MKKSEINANTSRTIQETPRKEMHCRYCGSIVLGGKTSSSVSKKTSVVIVGENAGSKYDKALSAPALTP